MAVRRTMSIHERETRRDEMIAMHRDGKCASDIGKRTNVTAQCARDVLRWFGETVADPSPGKSGVHQAWDYSDPEKLKKACIRWDAAFRAAVYAAHPEPTRPPDVLAFEPQDVPPHEATEQAPLRRILRDEGRAQSIEEVWPELPRPEPEPAFITAEPYEPVRTWKDTVREVCAKHGITKAEVISPQRARHIVAARHECFYRLSTETPMSLPQIGYRMGGKDHTTVLHGIRAHKQRVGLPL